MTESQEILAAGHPLWIPLPLDCSAEVLEAELTERFAGRASDEQVTFVVGLLTQLAERLSQPPADGVPAVNMAAWVLLADPDGIGLRAFATLRAAALASDATREDCIEIARAGIPVFQEPVVEDMETRSGTAIALRYRPMVEADGTTEVHQVSAVLWPRPEHNVLYLLSNYCEDLVEAAEIADLLDELGAGIEGL